MRTSTGSASPKRTWWRTPSFSDGRRTEPTSGDAQPPPTPLGGVGVARPLLDLRARRLAGRALLGLAGGYAIVACFRLLATTALAGRPWLGALLTLFPALVAVAAAFLVSLRGHARAEVLALYAGIVLSFDVLAQLLATRHVPAWPFFAVVVGAVAIAEPLAVAVGVALLASGLTFVDAWARGGSLEAAGAAALGYAGLVLAAHLALVREKLRLAGALAELARLKHGIDQIEDGLAPAAPSSLATHAIRQLGAEGRRSRHLDRAAELERTLERLVRIARQALRAHAVLFFDLNRERDRALLRASAGPEALVADASLLVTQDPIAFVLDRKQSFYATDFKRLLHDLPYYRGSVKIGSLLAVPVFTAEVVAGVLIADRLETQSLTEGEGPLLEAFAELAGDAVQQTRAALIRDDLGAEFKAVYPVSQHLASLDDEAAVRQVLLRAARNLVAVDGAALVVADARQAYYVVEECHGWPSRHRQQPIALSERTWAAWALRSAEEPFLLDEIASHRDRMPVIAKGESGERSAALLTVPLRARDGNLAALLLTAPRGTFDATVLRVLGILANQAGAVIAAIREKESWKEQAARDALTGLFNRRAASDLLAQAIARESRQAGKLGLALLDLDHFKKLNDTYGHAAGDAALRHVARVVEGHLRKGDVAGRWGGEEFVVILSGAAGAGARQLAERVRAALEANPVVFEGTPLSLTASLGLAVWPEDGNEPDALLAAADRALYAAKAAGRNRVMAASCADV